MSERLAKLDLVFIVDNTGSMGPYIQITKSKILEIIRTITKEEMCQRLRVGLVSYRDHKPEENTFVTRTFELTDDIAGIEKSVLAMEASGGGDGPEAVADALYAANNINWDRDAAKVAVLVADAPPHGVEDEDKWEKCPEGIIWEDEAKKAFDAGIIFHTVGCYPEIENYAKAVSTFKKIASETKGQFFALDQAQALVEIITGIAVEEIDKLAIQKSILEEIGVDLDSVDEETLEHIDVSSVVSRMKAKGGKRRVVVAERAASPEAVQEVELKEAEISEDDVREAIRQIRKKMK
ncbi:MAG: vWA domain-containing protein [Candidatus Thorarchaeota archaeon]